MKFLGIRNGHDCNISYSDGTKVRYIKFERNFQEKHFHWPPIPDYPDDMPYLLEKTRDILGIDYSDLDGIAMSADVGIHAIDRPIPRDETYIKLDKKLNPLWDQFSCPVYHIDHHFCHTLSCWPLVDITTVNTEFVLDGLGDYGRHTSFFKNKKLVEEIDRTQNLGLSVTMERIGQAMGMHGMVLDIAGKLMALKAYHTMPDDVSDYIFNMFNDTEFKDLNPFINACLEIQTKSNPELDDKTKLLNLAHLLHVWGEKKLPDYFAKFMETSDEVITYSGGTAQNTVVNTKLKERFPNLIIPPHCPDDGLSLGCIELLRQLNDQPLFDRSNFPYWQSDIAPDELPTQETIDKTAEYLAQGKIVGWYQGYGEIGPRALGNRSILMDPSIKLGKDVINAKVKRREAYRPFGASVLLEDTPELFDCDYDSPYMLYVVKCKKQEEFPAIIHVDNTCRIQTVNQDPQNEVYHNLISTFKKKTGIPMLLNTSLNIDGKPIAGDPSDAHKLFEISDLDVVVVGNTIRLK